MRDMVTNPVTFIVLSFSTMVTYTCHCLHETSYIRCGSMYYSTNVLGCHEYYTWWTNCL